MVVGGGEEQFLFVTRSSTGATERLPLTHVDYDGVLPPAPQAYCLIKNEHFAAGPVFSWTAMDEQGNVVSPDPLDDPAGWMQLTITCPWCSAKHPVTNAISVPLPGGGHSMYFASNAEERAAVDAFVEFAWAGSDLTADQVADELEARLPRFKVVADWVRSHPAEAIGLGASLGSLAIAAASLVLQCVASPHQPSGITPEQMQHLIDAVRTTPPPARPPYAP